MWWTALYKETNVDSQYVLLAGMLVVLFGACYGLYAHHRYFSPMAIIQNEIRSNLELLSSLTQRLLSLSRDQYFPNDFKKQVPNLDTERTLLENEIGDAKKYGRSIEWVNYLTRIEELSDKVRDILRSGDLAIFNAKKAKNESARLLLHLPGQFAKVGKMPLEGRSSDALHQAKLRYEEAKKKVDEGGDLDWFVIYNLLLGSRTDTETAHGYAKADQRLEESPSATLHEGSNSTGDTLYHKDDATSAPETSYQSESSSHSTDSGAGDSGGGDSGGAD